MCLNLLIIDKQYTPKGYPHGLVASMFDISVNEFEFQSQYYVHFRIITLEKGMNLLNSQL